ncbi:MAG TPA: hypothetical protein VGK73_03465 [Polyangiaceae bacterium]
MANLMKQPEPGDLITAQDISSLITAVVDLQKRVTELEVLVPGAGGATTIFDLQWCGPALRVGEEMRIVGLNLGLEGEGEVRFKSLDPRIAGVTAVTDYEEISHDRLILVKVPRLTVSESGQKYEVSVVRKDNRQDSRHVLIHPRLNAIPEGKLELRPAPTPSQVVNSGTLTLVFPLVVSSLNLDAEFDVQLSALLEGKTSEALTVQALDEDDKVITRLALPKTEEPGYRTVVKARVTIPERSTLELVKFLQSKLIVRLALASTGNPALNQGPIELIVPVLPVAPGETPDEETKLPIVFDAPEPGKFLDGSFVIPASLKEFRVRGRIDLSDMAEGEALLMFEVSEGWKVAPSRLAVVAGRTERFDVTLLRVENAGRTATLSIMVENKKSKEFGAASFPIVSSIKERKDFPIENILEDIRERLDK